MIEITLLRVVSLVAIAVTCGSIASVLALYWRAFRRARAQRRLRPLHVALVSAGVLLIEVALGWGQIVALERDSPAVPLDAFVRQVMFLGGTGLFVAALAVISLHLRRSTPPRP